MVHKPDDHLHFLHHCLEMVRLALLFFVSVGLISSLRWFLVRFPGLLFSRRRVFDPPLNVSLHSLVECLSPINRLSFFSVSETFFVVRRRKIFASRFDGNIDSLREIVGTIPSIDLSLNRRGGWTCRREILSSSTGNRRTSTGRQCLSSRWSSQWSIFSRSMERTSQSLSLSLNKSNTSVFSSVVWTSLFFSLLRTSLLKILESLK